MSNKNNKKTRNVKKRKTQRGGSKKNCEETFCKKSSALTRRNLERLKFPEKDIVAGVKFDSKNCPKNYCNKGCSGSQNKKLIENKFINDGFFKTFDDKDIKTSKSLGALSSCQPFKTPFIVGTPKEVKKGWKIFNDLPVK